MESLNDVSVINRTPGAIHVLTNRGTIGCLGMTNVYAKAGDKVTGGAVVSNPGTIRKHLLQEVFTSNVAPDIVK